MKSFLTQIEESFQSLDEMVRDTNESAKPDFLDLDNDGNKTEPMKSAGVSISDIDGLAKDSNDIRDFLKKFFNNPDYNSIYKKDPNTINWLKDIYDAAHLDEMSTSAAAAPYSTPNAFSKRTNPNINKSTGYKPTSKTKLHTEYDLVQETLDRKYERLIEGYKHFSLGNGKSNPSQTVNRAIRDVSKKLKEIEETVKYTSRLKTESGISHSGFSSGTRNALTKISERLIKISERVRTLGE